MSNEQFWQDGNDDDNSGESNAMRVLREKADADSKVIREMAERLQKMEQKESRNTLEASLKGKGLDLRVADLIPDGTDPDEWLKTYGALLKSGEVATDDTEGEEIPDGVSAEDAAALAALSKAGSDATPKVGLDAVEARINSFENEEELLKFLQSQG